MAGVVRVAPITDADVPAVADFLHANLNGRVSAGHWAEALDVPWEVERPNAGFMLLDDGVVVGVQLAFYSERLIEGRHERFCNLGAWCVLPDYRFHGLRLLKSALDQEGYHFTDLSPSGNVVDINSRLDFRFLDTSTFLVPNLPWPGTGGATISSDPGVIERALEGHDLQLYRDHATAGAARHLVLIEGADSCYVVFRKDRVEAAARVRDRAPRRQPGPLPRPRRPLARHLLIHHGAVGTLVEPRIVGDRPRLSVAIRSPRRKMFRSDDLAPAQVDYLYSELVCVAW